MRTAGAHHSVYTRFSRRAVTSLNLHLNSESLQTSALQQPRQGGDLTGRTTPWNHARAMTCMGVRMCWGPDCSRGVRGPFSTWHHLQGSAANGIANALLQTSDALIGSVCLVTHTLSLHFGALPRMPQDDSLDFVALVVLLATTAVVVAATTA